jgi:hypothetical protein
VIIMSDESALDSPPVVEQAIDVPWLDLIDELLSLRGLEDDWDGQGGEAPDPALVDGAIVLARRFQDERETPADRVTAGVNGTIFFGWHFPGGYREVEVISPTEAEVRLVRDGTVVADESFFCLIDELLR